MNSHGQYRSRRTCVLSQAEGDVNRLWIGGPRNPCLPSWWPWSTCRLSLIRSGRHLPHQGILGFSKRLIVQKKIEGTQGDFRSLHRPARPPGPASGTPSEPAAENRGPPGHLMLPGLQISGAACQTRPKRGLLQAEEAGLPAVAEYFPFFQIGVYQQWDDSRSQGPTGPGSLLCFTLASAGTPDKEWFHKNELDKEKHFNRGRFRGRASI